MPWPRRITGSTLKNGSDGTCGAAPSSNSAPAPDHFCANWVQPRTNARQTRPRLPDIGPGGNPGVSGTRTHLAFAPKLVFGPRLVCSQDPFGTLRNVAEISQITGYRVPAASIEERA